MIKIRRRKPIFEDDLNTALQPATTTQQPATGTTAPAPQPAQPQLNTNTTTQPLQPAQPNQTQDLNAQQQPNQQLDLNQQLQQPNPNAQKVLDMLKKMENTWWMISTDLPSEIQKEIPDFKQGNQQADPAIKAWNDYKQNPSEDTFKKFLEGFKAFGGVSDGLDNQANGLQQPQLNQQQQPSTQPLQPAQPQLNVNAGVKAAYSFRKKLMENLEIANKKKYYNTICEDFFDKTEFTL